MCIQCAKSRKEGRLSSSLPECCFSSYLDCAQHYSLQTWGRRETYANKNSFPVISLMDQSEGLGLDLLLRINVLVFSNEQKPLCGLVGMVLLPSSIPMISSLVAFLKKIKATMAELPSLHCPTVSFPSIKSRANPGIPSSVCFCQANGPQLASALTELRFPSLR